MRLLAFGYGGAKKLRNYGIAEEFCGIAPGKPASYTGVRSHDGLTTSFRSLPMSDSTIEISDDEASLISRLQNGDATAFELVVRTYGSRLLAVTRRFLRNEEDANDALQEALLSAFRSIRGFSGNSRLGTWLHRIAVNAALMRLRSQSRGHEFSIEELLPRFLEDGHQVKSSVGWNDTAESLIERRETAELVRQSIDRLPESYRSILLIRDIEEIDTEEAARMLEISPGAVKTRLHRARQALRTLLDPHFQGELV